MSDNKQEQQAVAKREPVTAEYIPYGAKDEIKLSILIIQNLIAVKTKTGKTCSERDAIRFMAMARSRRLDPFEGDCFLIGYDTTDGPVFTLVTAHQAYLKRAELHPEFDGMKSGIIVEEDGVLKDLEGDFFTEGQKVVGGWATVFFKNRKQPMHKRVRLARFQKSFGVWRDDPAGMICKCAEADALRSSFPTMLGGLYMREEMELAPVKAEFAKPIFQSRQIEEAKPATEPAPPPPEQPTQPEPEPEPAFEELPPQPPQPPPPPSGAFNPVKALRMLCKSSHILESDLLKFLAELGFCGSDIESLEQLQLQGGDTINAVANDFDSLSKKILAAKAAAS